MATETTTADAQIALDALARVPAGTTKEDDLLFVRAVLTHLHRRQQDALDRDATAESFGLASRQFQYFADFRRLAGRDFDPATDAVSPEELASRPITPPPPAPAPIPPRAAPDLTLGTSCFSGSDRARPGETIRNPDRWMWSSRWRACPWWPKSEYGPHRASLCAEWDSIQQEKDTARHWELARDYFARCEAAEAADKAEAEGYPDDDGPPYVVVVENVHNPNAAEDPECFDGDRWVTVACPLTEEPR